ncbi:MAG: penicillin-binding protein 2 [Eggerthellaceae bacterium]|nr:penicillin-binding protein 2 [Eggerthellaceae bacterium]
MTSRRDDRGSRRPRQRARVDDAGVAVGSARAFIPILLFAIIALICIGRLVYLQVIKADEYSEKAATLRTADIEISPRRGTIYDRNGNVLAMSVDATTIYADPTKVTKPQAEAEMLANILGGEASDYLAKFENKESSFVYIKRKADVAVAQQVQDLGLDGIYFLEDVRREYPYGRIAGQIVGFCNIDGEGISGLELYYDEILKGTPGRLVLERSRDGVPIPGSVKERVNAVDGKDIMISIDVELQEEVENRLIQAQEEIEGTSTNCIILDAGTGEIYATASLPLFNPADTSVVEEGATSVQTISTAFEPGSIFKAVSALALFEEGTVTADTEFDCPAFLEADEYYISDAHPRPDMTMSFRTIIADSSNVGISLAVQKMGFAPYYKYLVKYGFGDYTGVDYPGESAGFLNDPSNWALIQAFNITFGQGIMVTPLQMVSTYGLMLNNGVRCQPHFLIENLSTGERTEYEKQEIVVNKQALANTTDVLESVVDYGTGTDAQIDDYTVAGKTGTAEIASESGGYEESIYNLSFIGYLPDTNSKLVCFVGATKVPYERNTVSVFRDIMEYAISHYRILPD